MSASAEILVGIISIFLAFFLLLGIVLTIYLIDLTRQIREVTKTAGRTVANIESVVDRVVRLTSPVLFAEIIKNFIKKIKKDKEEK